MLRHDKRGQRQTNADASVEQAHPNSFSVILLLLFLLSFSFNPSLHVLCGGRFGCIEDTREERCFDLVRIRLSLMRTLALPTAKRGVRVDVDEGREGVLGCLVAVEEEGNVFSSASCCSQGRGSP